MLEDDQRALFYWSRLVFHQDHLTGWKSFLSVCPVSLSLNFQATTAPQSICALVSLGR